MTTPAARPGDRTTRRSPVRTAALLYGAVFLLVGAAGFIPGLTTNYGLLIDKDLGANFVPLNTADDWLHLLLGLTMVGLSFLDRRTRT
jgi:hypothetical protein